MKEVRTDFAYAGGVPKQAGLVGGLVGLGSGEVVELSSHMVSPDMKKLGHRRCLLVVVAGATCFARESGSFAGKSAPPAPRPPSSLQLVISPINKP